MQGVGVPVVAPLADGQFVQEREDPGPGEGFVARIGVDPGSGDSQFPATESVVRNGAIPIGLSVLFGAGVVTWLGWWGSVLNYRVPVRHWVRSVPISMPVVAVLGVNHPDLSDQPVSLALALVMMTALVGIGEGLMFRGIGVQVFQRAGLSEGKVALWSSVAFCVVHVSNAFGEGTQAVSQAVIVSTSGYFFYLCLRVGGTLLLPTLVHGLWDFSLASNAVGATPKAIPRDDPADRAPGRPDRAGDRQAPHRRTGRPSRRHHRRPGRPPRRRAPTPRCTRGPRAVTDVSQG
ncbi:CPBP family intramembrane glutamic endopeptidase [Streptomyces sp. NPDC004520]|uniref:CPBP family intramembrane glutamic endopeptidase n=1 Tax=Streptomyces sp. NPDC004520 TaxID=3364702 RepID=UPI0036C5F729